MTETIGFASAGRLAAELLGKKTSRGNGENKNGVDEATLGAFEKLRQILPTGNSDTAAETADAGGGGVSSAAALSSELVSALQSLWQSTDAAAATDGTASTDAAEATDAADRAAIDGEKFQKMSGRELERALKKLRRAENASEVSAPGEAASAVASLTGFLSGKAVAAYKAAATTAAASTLGVSV